VNSTTDKSLLRHTPTHTLSWRPHTTRRGPHIHHSDQKHTPRTPRQSVRHRAERRVRANARDVVPAVQAPCLRKADGHRGARAAAAMRHRDKGSGRWPHTRADARGSRRQKEAPQGVSACAGLRAVSVEAHTHGTPSTLRACCRHSAQCARRTSHVERTHHASHWMQHADSTSPQPCSETLA